MPATHKKTAPGKSGRNQIGDTDPVEALLTDLECMGVEELRALWKKRFRHRLPGVSSPDILRRLIAWKIQVQAFGGLDPDMSRQLTFLMRSAEKCKPGDTQVLPLISLRPGTILVREWRGVEHRVLVLETGFEYRDRRFASLSHVARHISGTHWSGPRFFGLEPQQLKQKPER
jgi:hypothetical protein